MGTDYSPMLPQKHDATITGFEPALPSIWKAHEESTISAWIDAGASFSWFTVDKYGFPNWEEAAVAGSVRGLQFCTWRNGVMARMPVPEFPFGLFLYETQITDDGLKELTGLKSLTALHLASTKITDAGLKHLTKLENLTTLSLFWTNVTDAGLKHLFKLTNLTTLDLSLTKVTDAGLKHLVGLENLTMLYLFSTQVTNASVKKLQKALPECLVRY